MLRRQLNQKVYWRVPRDCDGETVFVIAGGPSVSDLDLSRLKGRRVMVINSSYEAYPDAELLFFGDDRWRKEHRKRLFPNFAGKVITTATDCPVPRPGELEFGRLLFLKPRTPMLGLSPGDDEAVIGRTSLSATIDIAAKRGFKRIALLGADMRKAADGRTHHHSPHNPKWSLSKHAKRKDKYQLHMDDLRMLVEPLRQRGIEVLNCSPVSLIDFWPKADFNELTKD